MAKSSKTWLRRHVTDPYVRKARGQGYRSRAAFKLLELDQKERFLRPGASVLDLGAAPGGWSQVATARVGPEGRVVAVDVLPIAPISGVKALRADFRDAAAQVALGAGPYDVLLCDVAPNLSGVAAVDQARGAELALAALGLARRILAADGVLVVKLFHGAAFDEVVREIRRSFRRVQVRKPQASRGESSETYVVARCLLCSAKTA